MCISRSNETEVLRLRAKVRHVTGLSRHYLGTISDEGSLEAVAEFPRAHWVEIEQGNEGYYLLYLDEGGHCFTNGWYLTLEQAKAQTKSEFDIEEDDWVPVT
jgi:hypothetical protein